MLLCSTPNPLSVKSPTKSSEQSLTNKPHPSISLIQISTNLEELIQLHTLLIKTALIQEKRAFGRFLSTLTRLSDPSSLIYAQKLFDSPDSTKNSFTYNTMIKAYSRSTHKEMALCIHAQMISEEKIAPPDDYTFTFVLTACSKLAAVFEGKQIHAQMLKNPSRIGTNSLNSLMGFYSKIGYVSFVGRRIFDGISEPDIVSCNCLLDWFVKLGELEHARQLFDKMPERDIISWTTMLVGYANAGFLSEACCLFDEMTERNVVSWSVMLNGYMKWGRYKEALGLFKEFQDLDVKADKVMMTLLLSACSNLGALDQGSWIHAYIGKHAIEIDAHLATALVDMYSKCGRIDVAMRIFRGAVDKKESLWNAMLGGLAMHSQGEEAIELFSEMTRRGIKPNEITFICILSACSHSGLVDHGLQIFGSMVEDHSIVPTIEHYGCLVDLLGRAGLLIAAKQVIESMPMQPDGNIWRSLLGACRLHGDIELLEHLGRILIELEPWNDSNYVLLSNVYAMAHSWEEVSKLRSIMKIREVQKTPGCSSIELDGVIHEFVAGDYTHHQRSEIYLMLRQMNEQLLDSG